jgi:signal peptidase I
VFSFLYSEKKKMRQTAANWLEVADRVQKFRRDQLNEAQGLRLHNAVTAVRQRLKEKADPGILKPAIESLEAVLRDIGGRIYPQSGLVENVEFFLVAAIVILGLRAYFIQPFKIPTNSMWPSYYGLTAEVFTPGAEPGPARKAVRLLAMGAHNYTIKAPADGEVMIPVFGNGQPAHTEKAGRSMFVFPTLLREYTIAVSGQFVRFSAPADWARSDDFGYGETLAKTLFAGDRLGLIRATRAANAAGKLESSTMQVQSGAQSGQTRIHWVPTGRKVRKGETILAFDILSGDLLFVERLSYHFVPPSVGDGFVFKTGGIISPRMQEATGGLNQYYVKRLVGTPGDTLEIREPALYRNGQPITGSPAFGKNARREGLYPGYKNSSGPIISAADAEAALPPGATLTVPPDSYYALGDNSPSSLDSRFWGFVPEKDVVGRPLFIYYPLTKRWGLTK